MKKLVLLFMLLAFLASGATAAINKSAVKYYKFAATYHKKNDYKNAIAYYNAAVKKEKKFWQAWLGLGICYYNLKKYRNAKLIFKYTLILKPDEPTASKYYEMLDPKFKSKKKKEEKKTKTKMDLMWRSALIPGAGQFYNDDLVKGYIFTLSYLATAGAIIAYTLQQQDAVDEYNNTNYDFENKYKIAEEASGRVWIPIGMAGLIWIVSMVDAYMSGTDVPVSRQGGRAEIMEYKPGLNVAINIAEFRF